MNPPPHTLTQSPGSQSHKCVLRTMFVVFSLPLSHFDFASHLKQKLRYIYFRQHQNKTIKGTYSMCYLRKCFKSEKICKKKHAFGRSAAESAFYVAKSNSIRESKVRISL